MVGTPVAAEVTEHGQVNAVSFRDALRFWLTLGFISFGGPTGQIAIMHRELVEKKRWIGEAVFLRALNFCMLLPGPEAQQLAIYIGWRLHGYLGGVVAGALFVIPSIFVLLLLSWLSVAYGNVPAIAGLFYGIQPVVIAVVVEAVLRIGKRTLHHPLLIGFAVVAFLALRVFGLPFPLVIAAAAAAGLLLQRPYPHVFRPRGHGAGSAAEPGAVAEEPHAPLPSLGHNIKLIGVFVLLWAIPVGALWWWRGSDDVLVREARFFTQAAFITFGGAYAVLSYIADVATNRYNWLTAAQMVHGLGLAESTPGPLIMVTQYVGFLGAWKFHGSYAPLLYGTLGALVTTYVTFLPCFLFIFLGAPYIELLGRKHRIQAALAGVTAAVVGVVMNLAVFFALKVLFPTGHGLDIFALVMAIVSFVLLERFKWPIHVVLPVGAVVGLLWTLAGTR